MINWTDYFRYRAALRGFDLAKLEEIIRRSSERYSDIETGRHVVVGRHDQKLVMIAYETEAEVITPVTVHSVTRQQIRFRLSTGRLVVNE